VSLLSKKISLSVTPPAKPLKRSDVELYLRDHFRDAFNQWTGRSSWTMACDRVSLQLAKDAFGDENQTEACLVSSKDSLQLIHLNVPAGLQKLATANALGVEISDMSDAFEEFSKVHSRGLIDKLVETFTDLDLQEESRAEWISSQAIKLHCTKAPDTWLCKSNWTLFDAAEDTAYKVTLTVNRSMLPDFDELSGEDDDVPTLERLGETLGPCRLPVRIIGGKVTLSIADCMKLEIGQTFELPEIDFNAVDMKMPNSEDVLVQATLGTHFGAKAVRLSSGVDDDFLVRYAAELETS
jgi:hypothetical protein